MLWTLIVPVPYVCVCVCAYVESLFVNGNSSGLFFFIKKIRFTCLVSGRKRFRCIYERNHKSGIHLRIPIRPFHVHMIKSLSFLRCVIPVVIYVCKKGCW